MCKVRWERSELYGREHDQGKVTYAGIILAQDFCERKNPIWTKTVRDFQIQ